MISSAVRDHCEARGAAIYLNDEGMASAIRAEGPFPAGIGVDDPLIVKLRRWNEPVDTRDVRTAFPDGMVFPVTARGKLRGALACQAKRDGSAFDPDERESLGQVARGVGAGLDALASPDGNVLNVLTALNASIKDGFASLAAKIDAFRAGETNARRNGDPRRDVYVNRGQAARLFFGGRPPNFPFAADDDALCALFREPKSCAAALRTMPSPAAAIISVSRRTPISGASNQSALPGASISSLRSATGAIFSKPGRRRRGIMNVEPVLRRTTIAS